MWVATVVAVIGAGVSIYGQNEQKQAAKATANYKEKLARNEADAKEMQAHVESQQMQKNKQRLLAAQRAGFAKGGSVITEGTPLLLMAEQAGNAELDILNQQRNRGIEAASLRSEADLTSWSSKQASKAANIGMAGTAIGGASKAYGAYKAGKK